MEATAKQIVETHISNSLECEWLCEGTLADGIIRPSLCLDDAWIGIQVKSTAGLSNGVYHFHHTNRYNGLLILCIGLDQKLLWTIPGCDVKVTGISVTPGGKWDAYRCSWHDVSSTLGAVQPFTRDDQLSFGAYLCRRVNKMNMLHISLGSNCCVLRDS